MNGRDRTTGWAAEHGSAFRPPAEIELLCELGVLADISWRHDASPSFAFADLVDESDGPRLFAHPKDPGAREYPQLPRFFVLGQEDLGIYMGDDLGAALEVMRREREERGASPVSTVLEPEAWSRDAAGALGEGRDVECPVGCGGSLQSPACTVCTNASSALAGKLYGTGA